jgi:PAS domain S-box-containing protein
MPTGIKTPDLTAGIPDQPDHGGGVFSVLGVELTALLAALLLILIAVSVFPSQQTVASLAAYLPLQAVLQMFAIVVSILIFAVGWVAYSRERVGNSALLSCAFLAVGLMDFAYTMAFPGMPDFVTPSSEGKAVDFWLAARALAACALLYAAIRPWRPFASLQTRYWLLVGALGITALVYWLVLFFEGALPATFIPGQGPTPFKTGVEYSLIAVYALAAAVFFARLRIERADYLRRLFTACCVIMFSELYFTFYGDVTDINNLPGHLYNLIAYLLIYQSLLVRGALEPYQRLQQSRQPRRKTMERRRKGLASDWWRVGLSSDWYREQDGAAAQAMLAAIVENSNAAIVGCALDATIVSWNDAAEQMFGWSASEAIGQPITIITPPQLHGLLQPLFEQAARGEPVGQVESRYLRRDGTCIDTAGTLVAIRDANGEPVFFTLTLWDITQQKQLEREVRQKEQDLLESQKQFQQLAEHIPQAFWITDMHRNELIYLSPAHEQIYGQRFLTLPSVWPAWKEAVYAEDRERVLAAYREMGSRGLDERFRIRQPNGDLRWMHARGFPVRDANGTVYRVVGTVEDITVEKQAEQEIARLNQSLEQRVRDRTQQLEATNKELEAFSYSVSHDLRAPLRGIDGFSQILLQKHAGQLDATGSDYLQRIRRASLRMAELIDDLLQLSWVSRSQIRTEPLDLSGLARSILATHRESGPERTVVTEVQDGIELSADPRLLKIVLENLLGNAWKFTGKRAQATIRVSAREQDGELVVFVTDNGAGFDMKYAHKLFGAFQRLHGATEFEGTGIGLATVQRIINLHGGRIWADSTPGKGATFYFVIPRAPDSETPTA